MLAAQVLPSPRRPRTAPPAALLDGRDAALLLDAAEDDATATADALHDGALQALVVARYAADLAARGGDPALARDAVQDALVALRRAVWALRPRGGDGLARALTDLGVQREAAGLPHLDLDLDPATDDLQPTAARLAYRAVQASGATSVTTARTGADLELRLPGGVLPEPWAARAEAVGGRLDPGPVLVLPLDPRPEGDR